MTGRVAPKPCEMFIFPKLAIMEGINRGLNTGIF